MSESNGKESASSGASNQPPPGMKNMKELKAKWLESVRELNENAAAAAQAHAQANQVSPQITRVKPKVMSERLPRMNLNDEVGSPSADMKMKRTSLMGSGSIRMKFNAEGGPDPPKPPPSPFEPYAFADFTVPMTKVVQEVERCSNTGKSTSPRSIPMHKIAEATDGANTSSKADSRASPAFGKKSDGGWTSTDPTKVVLSMPSPPKTPPLPSVPEKPAAAKAASSFCLCFRPRVSD